jgi:hypothetical protein
LREPTNESCISSGTYNETREEMKKRGWILAIAWWLYILTGVFLYVHFGFTWVNTVDVLLTFALLIAFSVWYVIERIRSGPGKSCWVIGWMGVYRRKSQRCSMKVRQ